MHQLTSFAIVVNGNEKNNRKLFISVNWNWHENRLFENEIVHFIFTSFQLPKND